MKLATHFLNVKSAVSNNGMMMDRITDLLKDKLIQARCRFVLWKTLQFIFLTLLSFKSFIMNANENANALFQLMSWVSYSQMQRHSQYLSHKLRHKFFEIFHIFEAFRTQAYLIYRRQLYHHAFNLACSLAP